MIVCAITIILIAILLSLFLFRKKKVQYRKENNIDSMLFDRHVYFVQYHYAAIFHRNNCF